jgi:hypothetical protein
VTHPNNGYPLLKKMKNQPKKVAFEKETKNG